MYVADIVCVSGDSTSPNGAANRWFCQQWKAGDTYGWQVAWSFSGGIYKRQRANSNTWSAWVEK